MKKKIFLLALAGLLAVAPLSACTVDRGGGADGHKHTYSEEWSNDENYHWHDSECGHNVVSGRGKHKMQGGACTVCGYKEGGGLKIDANTDVTKIPTEVVTEAEWEAALSAESFRNFTLYSPGAAEGDHGDVIDFAQTTYYTEDGCMFVATSEGEPFENGYLDVVYWREKSGETMKYYQYEHNGNNGGWTRQEIEEGAFQEGMQLVYHAYCSGLIYAQLLEKFNEATYNATDGYYKVTMELLGEEETYEYEVRLRFMDGKLFAFGGQTPTPYGPIGEISYAKIFDYGTTVVPLPQIVNSAEAE